MLLRARLIVAVTAVAALVIAFAVVHYAQPGWYVRLWHPLRYDAIVVGYARQNRLDPALLAAVIYQESKFNASAKSDRGAIGLMQLLPATAKGIAVHTGGSKFQVSDLSNPDINVRYGAWYLRHLLDRYSSVRLALAAYNAGQANVDRWRARGEPIQFPETRAFVAHVLALERTYRGAYASLRQQSDT